MKRDERTDQQELEERAAAQEPRTQSDPDSVVKKGGIAKSDAEVADVTRDTHGFPADDGGVGATSPPPDLRRREAGRVNAQLDEAIESQRADQGETEANEGAGQPEGERASGRNRVVKGQDIDEAEAPGE